MKGQASDQYVRNQVIDTSTSYIVEAPAGSGKTELLVTRYVSLLSEVSHPEKILAITFTVKAANEMKHRVLHALASIKVDEVNISNQLRTAARAAAKQDEIKQWHLLNNPSRLKIMTIDSLNNRLVHMAPLQTGIYGRERINSDDSLYRKAANSLLARLQEAPEQEESALERVFAYYGCDGKSLERTIISMLKQREQWLSLLTDLKISDASKLHSKLNEQIKKQAKLISDRFEEALLPWLDKIEELAHFALSNILPENELHQPLSTISRGLKQDTADAIEYWQSLQKWILTTKNTLRQQMTRTQGFPTNKTDTDFAVKKKQMNDLLDSFRQAGLECILQEQLPPAYYSKQQIQILIDFADVFLQSAAWLQLVHNEFNTTDFSGMGQKALDALGGNDVPALLAEQTYDRIEHILIDEFQDTSMLQYELIKKLVTGWSTTENRSLFIVGDPKQSIYRFRQAEPGLFHIVRTQGLENIKPVARELQSNFRSTNKLVDWYNNVFSKIFSRHPDYSIGETDYKVSVAERPCIDIEAVRFHIADVNIHAEENISRQLVQEIMELQERDEIQTIAILTHTRTEALKAMVALRETSIDYYAIDIEPPDQKQHIIDLISLARALSNEDDKISWLALLRHPAIGMSLNDLMCVSTQKDNRTIWETIKHPPDTISAHGKKQIEHIHDIMAPIMGLVWSSPWRQLVEDSWYALGMETLLTQEEKKQGTHFLNLLTEHSGDTIINFDAITDSLQHNRYSQRPLQNTDQSIYLMTIHKAKGLEFDAVLIPGIERNLSKKGGGVPPFRWDTIVNKEGTSLILAPYKSRLDRDTSNLYKYLAYLEKRKETAEQQRLLYVACTRAKVCLRLFAILKLEKLQEPGNNFAKWLLQAGVTHRIVPENSVQTKEAQKTPILTRYSLPKREHKASKHLITSTSNQIHKLQKDTYQQLQGIEIHNIIDKVSSCPNLDEYLVNRQSIDRFIYQNREPWLSLLRWRGVPIDYRQKIVDQAALAIGNMMHDHKGKWLLSHKNANNEWGIQTIDKAGKIMTRIIDRTFVENDTRWIIDYKTITQHPEESREQLIERVKKQYQPQLQQYAEIIYPTEKLSVRLCLYLILQPIWIDWQWTPDA